MAERQVTIDGITYPLPQPFHVIATSNPVEFDGTYPLPEAQLDRFMVRLSVGYLSAEDEAHMVTRRLNRHTDTPTVQRIVSSNDFHTMQETIETVLINPDIVDYCVNLVHATRTHAATEVGASPRASQALALLARAYAVVQGRDYVIPEDVKTIAPAVLAHRLTLTATAWATNVDPANIVHSILTSVPTPAITTPTP